MARDIRNGQVVEVPENYTLHIGIITNDAFHAENLAHVFAEFLRMHRSGDRIASGWSLTGTDAAGNLDWSVHTASGPPEDDPRD